jgi:hypothetical protein
MPFGLTAPATFKRMMDVLLSGLKWITCLVYLDDIVIISKTFAGLKFKLSKCTFFANRLKVLGYIVSGDGLSPDPSKVATVQDFPIPTTVRDIQSFIGLCSYYRRFIPKFTTIARPLTNLTKKNQPFHWTQEHQHSFEQLQRKTIGI